MGRFLEYEKARLTEFKATSRHFSEEARAAGIFAGKARPFCLPVEFAKENIFADIRDSAVHYFCKYNIKWHNGHINQPSNHLCDSQVCCVNFLFPFAHRQLELAELLRPVFPSIREMLPIENDQYVGFEWIGLKNYLGEKTPANGNRSRGANCTSADAIVMFERKDGLRQTVLIEWKYTESYGSTPLKIANSGTDRSKIYAHLFAKTDCPINKQLLPADIEGQSTDESLYYEPFYQFMRQQYLANEMERAHELRADIVSLLHIAPGRNTDFHKVTSPKLVTIGETATGVWSKLIVADGRFISVTTEQLFGRLSTSVLPGMREWLEYIGARYPWVSAGKR